MLCLKIIFCFRFNSSINPSSPSKTITGNQTPTRSNTRTRESTNFNTHTKPLVSSKSLKAPDNNLLLNDASLNIYENHTPGSSKRCDHVSLNIYENPTPGPSKQCEQNIDNYDDNLSDISNLFDSDDSVADPDFSMTDTYKHHFPSYISESSIGSNEEINLNQEILVANSTLALPPILPIKPVYIATYPDSLIFVDHQQAASYIEPTYYSENTRQTTPYFIAKYPGPIFINKHSNINYSRANSEINVNVYHDDEENAEQTSSSHIFTSIEMDQINKNKTKHPFIENDCGGKCKRKCNLLTLDERKNIWNMYWSMKYERRRNFLNKCTKIDKIKRRTVTEVNSNSKYHKKESRFYYLPKNNEEINVCRTFFLNTLGHKNDSVITELSRAIKRKALYGDVKENRGGKKPKIDRNPIELHINSYNPAVSHYRRSNAPLAKYLPRTLTLNKMFSDFKSKFPNHTCSKEVYRQTINSMNISFKFPKGDKCVECGIYEEKIKIYNNDVPENVKATYMNHKTKANKAIQKYQEDASQENTANVRYYSMDLQKVMLLPDMPKVKDSFFLSRLIAFNLTFAPLMKKSNFNSICVLWHEAYAGRDANNIVDAIATFIEKERDVQHLVLWCDNCTSQNKNWIIFTALVTIVNCGFSNLESLTIKYLTKGHTHMSADGVHGNIEKQIKKQDAVYDFEDYKNVISGCRSNIEVHEVKKSYQWVKKKRAPRRNDECDPLHNFLLNSLVEVKFINGCRNLFYKTDIDQPYMELDFLMKKFNPRSLPSMNNSARGIKESKKEGIITKLLPLMPMNRREFWQLLTIDNSSLDLVTDGQLVVDD